MTGWLTFDHIERETERAEQFGKAKVRRYRPLVAQIIPGEGHRSCFQNSCPIIPA